MEKISTVNSSVTLKGLRGPVNVTTVNGAVVASELGGSAKLTTVNGAIRAEFGNVVAQQKLSFETVNGQIVVRLPKEAGFELHGSTVNGRVDCDFPIELGKRGGHNLSGRVGDARASLKAETVNGRVSIESL